MKVVIKEENKILAKIPIDKTKSFADQIVEAYQQGARDFAEWLCSKPLSIDTTRNCFVNTNDFTFDIDSIIAEWQKGAENDRI